MIASTTAPHSSDVRPHTRSVGRILTLLAAVLLATAFVWAYLGSASSASAAVNGSAVEQCNGLFSGGGEGAVCTVQINNFLNLETSAQSSEVIITACNGSEGVPDATCAPDIRQTFPFLITAVNQCNDAANGGGSRLTCSVDVVNTITGAPTPTGTITPTGASIRQCNDATAQTITCDPIGNTTDATIEQCNNSTTADGAGSTLTCAVTSSTQSTAIPMRIDQCNYSGTGNGSFVTCDTSIVHRIIPAVVVTPGDDTSTTPPPSPVAPVPDTTAPDATVPDTTTPDDDVTGDGTGEIDVPVDGTGTVNGTERTLAATGPESVATLAFGGVVLLFAGSLALLARSIHRSTTSTRNNHRSPR